jgi:hypothetical protein
MQGESAMKHHIMIAVGLLMLVIFFVTGLDAVRAPGLGLRELYVAGGFVLAGFLIHGGVREWRAARRSNSDQP